MTGASSIHASVSALWGPKALERLVDLNLSFDVERDQIALKRLGGCIVCLNEPVTDADLDSIDWPSLTCRLLTMAQSRSFRSEGVGRALIANSSASMGGRVILPRCASKQHFLHLVSYHAYRSKNRSMRFIDPSTLTKCRSSRSISSFLLVRASSSPSLFVHALRTS
jgi:hypothetical protein